MHKISKNMNSTKTILIGVAVAVAFSLALSAVGAYLIMGQVVNQNSISALSRVVAGISVFTATLLTLWKKGRGERLIQALAIALGYLLITFLVKLIFVPGKLQNVVIHILVCLASALLVTVLLNLKNNKRKVVALKRRR